MTVLSGSSAGKMIRNEMMMAAMLIGAAPIRRAGRRNGCPFGAAAHHFVCGRRSHSGVYAPGDRIRYEADRDCRRPGEGATPLRCHHFTQRQPEITMTAGVRGRRLDRRAAIASGTVDGDELGRKLDLLHRIFKEHPFVGAVEDLPPDGRDRLAAAATAAGSPEPKSLLARMLAEVEDAGLDSYGDLETVPLLHFLSEYPVTSYTYVASPVLSRGERPSPAKLQDLAAQGYQLTVSLCAEIPGGDLPLLLRAGRPGSLQAVHIPVVDMHNPTLAQVVQLLDLLSTPDA